VTFSLQWLYIFAILGGLVAGWRIWQNLQKLRRQKNDSWDARLIDQLRKRGSDPFKAHDVDFFLAFPTQDAAEDLARQLRGEGFDADVVDEPESGELRYSLHAHKSMKLTVPDMSCAFAYCRSPDPRRRLRRQHRLAAHRRRHRLNAR